MSWHQCSLCGKSHNGITGCSPATIDYVPIDEWCDRYAKDLRKDIKIHIEMCTPQDADRYIMVSIRQWLEGMK